MDCTDYTWVVYCPFSNSKTVKTVGFTSKLKQLNLIEFLIKCFKTGFTLQSRRWLLSAICCQKWLRFPEVYSFAISSIHFEINHFLPAHFQKAPASSSQKMAPRASSFGLSLSSSALTKCSASQRSNWSNLSHCWIPLSSNTDNETQVLSFPTKRILLQINSVVIYLYLRSNDIQLEAATTDSLQSKISVLTFYIILLLGELSRLLMATQSIGVNFICHSSFKEVSLQNFLDL